MRIVSSAFVNCEALPEKYSAKGGNISPPLSWADAPMNVQSFALLCEDPDAPSGNFTHWTVYNIPADWRSLPENFANSDIAGKVHQGKNGTGRIGYFGPQPPPNESHHYRFRLYAVSEKTDLPEGISEQELMQEIGSKVICESNITADFPRNERE